MTKIEMLILILAFCIPIFSFYIVFKPKLKSLFKKKEKQANLEVKEEIKQEEKPKQEKIEPIKEKRLSDEISGSFYNSGFKDYTETKRKNIAIPEMKFNKDFMPTYDLEEFDKPKPKSIVDQIRSLSPELKALIVAGVLDKKDIDNM